MTRSQAASAASLVFGDRRLDRRLRGTFNQLARRPAGTLPHKLPKRAALVGGYRMFNNRKVTHQAVLDAHRARCLERLRGQRGKVLLLHDTTVLDYSGLDVDGLGQVGDGHGKGLYAHHSLAVIPATRQVVGLMSQVLHRRATVPKGESKPARRARPDRESRLWTRAVAGLPPMPPGVAVTDVCRTGARTSASTSITRSPRGVSSSSARSTTAHGWTTRSRARARSPSCTIICAGWRR
jgi:hypothetical protein